MRYNGLCLGVLSMTGTEGFVPLEADFVWDHDKPDSEHKDEAFRRRHIMRVLTRGRSGDFVDVYFVVQEIKQAIEDRRQIERRTDHHDRSQRMCPLGGCAACSPAARRAGGLHRPRCS